ncbi:hypothetical protein [Lewinella sp. 4G2]|uniref:hypothetical protein n=1 Tax=Lewinella sp. 4G2 TaxID=1803372 RepID=UPI0007B4A079|nr:hypothetical protein [Lewinella sp. 4G2]OAV44720.1 hypothetical protein A3850_009550 [Lewinella sp. 4G2]
MESRTTKPVTPRTYAAGITRRHHRTARFWDAYARATAARTSTPEMLQYAERLQARSAAAIRMFTKAMKQ